MSRENLAEVKERARDIFLFRAPAFLRFGEPLLKAVDAAVAYAYRQGKLFEHESQQDLQHRENKNRFVATFSDNKGLLSNLVTLAVSASAASGAAVTVGPAIPPILGWGVVLLIVFALLLRALWSSGGK